MEVPRRFAGEGSEAVQSPESPDAHPLNRRATAAAGRLRADAEASSAARSYALITGARIGEAPDAALGGLSGRLPDVLANEERRRVRRIPLTETIAALLAARPRIHAWVFTNARTEKPCTTIRKVFERALDRAKISNRRRHRPHAAPHCTVAHDLARSRRLHRDVDLRPLIDAHARALHASDAGATHCRAGHVQLVHKMSTKLRTEKRQPKLPHLLGILVDGRRLELPTSALRTRRSPN